MLALVIIPAVVAVVWLLDRKDRRHAQERAQTLAVLVAEREAMEVARDKASPDLSELVALVDRLCQRVQAPEMAVMEHQASSMPVATPEAIGPDDDEAYWAARLTKEQLAEIAAEQELADRGVPA